MPFPSPLSLLLLLLPLTSATIFSPPITSCLSSTSSAANTNPNKLINITQAWAQIIDPARAWELGLVGATDGRRILRVNLVGSMGEELVGYSNETGKLATLFTNTDDITYNVWSTTTFVCNSLFPPSPLPRPYIPQNTTYCPLAAGELAMNISIPLDGTYGLTTLNNRIRIVDDSNPAQELSCITFDLSPYYPSAWYWSLLVYLPAGLAIGYWISSWAGRFAAGWVVGSVGEGEDEVDVRVGIMGGGGGRGRMVERRRKWGTMIVSGLSGERLGASGGLLRFITPGFRDVIWHFQFVGVLGMTAINWPAFAYPILAQGSWANLVWNVTLVQGSEADTKLVNLLNLHDNSLPENFASQMNDTSSPLYLDESIPNMFMNLGSRDPGIQSFSAAVGLRARDMYGTCLTLFMAIAAGIIGMSILIWVGHALVDALFFRDPSHSPSNSVQMQTAAVGTANSRRALGAGQSMYSNADSEFDSYKKKTSGESDGLPPTPGTAGPLLSQSQRNGAANGNGIGNGYAKASGQPKWKRNWNKFKLKGPIGAFHWAALCGNLVRILILFHLPITLFSVYQWTIREFASLASVILAALTFAVFSVLLPVYLLIVISTTPTAKLYDAMRTLLSLGPMYNIYEQGNQLYQALRFVASLATGIAIGAGQNKGTAQAIVLLIVELAFGLVTTIWQPWRPGAGMVIPGFLFTIIRIVSAVLLLVLSPAIGLDTAPAGWIAYTLLGLQAFALFCFLIMLASKVIEGLIRLFGNVKFADSTHPLDGGVIAAFGGLTTQLKRKKHKKAGTASVTRRSSGAGSVNTQMMLDRHSTSQAAGYSPRHSRTPSAGYFPPQRPPSSNWQPFQVPGVGYAPVHVFGNDDQPQEFLRDPNASKGFSVVRGGRANYEDPYAALPGNNRHSMNGGQPTYDPQQRPGLSHQQRASFADPVGTAPLRSPTSPGPRHTRTRSQTAIVESVPSSHSSSPKSLYPPLPPSNGNSPTWTPAGSLQPTPTAATFGVIPPPPGNPRAHQQMSAQRKPREEQQLSRVDSRSSVYSSEMDAMRKKSRPTSWFGIGGKKKAADSSDGEEELDDFAPQGEGKGRADTEPFKKGHASSSSSGGWKAALGLGGEKKGRPSIDERNADENAKRKSLVPSAHETDGSPAGLRADTGGRSFRVNRANSRSTTRTNVSASLPTSPIDANPPELPTPSDSSHQTQPARSFVVQRAQRPGVASANASRANSPSTQTVPLGEPDAVVPLQDAPRSFAVNRASRQGGGLGLSTVAWGAAGHSAGLPPGAARPPD